MQNCVPIRVTGLKNCVYIVAPTHIECVVGMQRKNIKIIQSRIVWIFSERKWVPK